MCRRAPQAESGAGCITAERMPVLACGGDLYQSKSSHHSVSGAVRNWRSVMPLMRRWNGVPAPARAAAVQPCACTPPRPCSATEKGSSLKGWKSTVTDTTRRYAWCLAVIQQLTRQLDDRYMTCRTY